MTSAAMVLRLPASSTNNQKVDADSDKLSAFLINKEL